MELSSVFASRFHPIFITQSSPPIPTSSFSPSSPLLPTSRPNNNNNSPSSTSSTISSTITRPNNASHTTQNPLSISHAARQSAILDIQQSSDLDSALARSGGMLRLQDLNIILRQFGKLNRWKELSQLFDWMRKNGKISTSSYSSYIKFMGKGLNPVKVLEIYNNIEDESTRNNVSVCNSVLSCLIRNGKFESSIRLFHQMKQDGLRPDVVTYSTVMLTTLLKVYVRGGLFEKSRELLTELEALGYAEDEMPYCLLMDGLAKAGQIHEAKSVFEEMMKKNVKSGMFSDKSMGLLQDPLKHQSVCPTIYDP